MNAQQNALALRQELIKQAAEKSVRQLDLEHFRGESHQNQFVRVIRDGVAAEVKNAILETRREIELNARQGKLSKSCKAMAGQFNEVSKAFLQYKLLLEKLESTIDRLKSSTFSTDVEELEQNKQQAEKVQKLCVSSGEKVIQFREKIERQIQEENKKLQNLITTFKRCKEHLPKLERGKIEISVHKALELPSVEHKIQVLSKIIEKLIQSVPRIRQQEAARVYKDAVEAFAQNEFDKTLSLLNQLFHLDKHHLDGHRLRSELYRIKNNRLALQTELKYITELKNAAGSDFFAYAEVLFFNHQLEDAYPYFQKAAKFDPCRQYLRKLGDAAFQLGQWFHAEKAYQRLYARFPDDQAVLHALVKVYFESGKIQKAYETIRFLETENALTVETFIYLGRIYRHYKMIGAAHAAFQHAAELQPDHGDANYWLSLTEYDRGDFNAALAYAQNADEIDPERSRNILLLAKCYAANGKHQQALSALQPLLDVSPPPIDILLSYSEICRTAGLEKQALDQVKHTLEKLPWQPMLKTEYGLLLAGLGRFEEAQRYLGGAADTP